MDFAVSLDFFFLRNNSVGLGTPQNGQAEASVETFLIAFSTRF